MVVDINPINVNNVQGKEPGKQPGQRYNEESWQAGLENTGISSKAPLPST